MEQQLDKVREELQRVRRFQSHPWQVIFDQSTRGRTSVQIAVQSFGSIAAAEMNDDQWLTVREGLVNAVTLPAMAPNA